MSSATRVGRTIAALFLVQGLLAPVVNFALLRPVTDRDFLATAAASAPGVRVAVVLSILLAGLTLVNALVALPVFRRHGERLALAFVALAATGVATIAIEGGALRQMLALSEAYAGGGATNPLLATLAPLARSAWRSAHFTNLLVALSANVLLYVILFRGALVPRAIAAVGMLAASIGVLGVAMPLLGMPFSFLSIAPMGLAHLALVGWLLVRGLADRPPAFVEKVALA